MSIKEKFCKYSKRYCPDCDSKMKIIDIIKENNGVSYTEKYEICECGFQHNITNKRNNNNKIIIEEEADAKNVYNKQRNSYRNGRK